MYVHRTSWRLRKPGNACKFRAVLSEQVQQTTTAFVHPRIDSLHLFLISTCLTFRCSGSRGLLSPRGVRSKSAKPTGIASSVSDICPSTNNVLICTELRTDPIRWLRQPDGRPWCTTSGSTLKVQWQRCSTLRCTWDEHVCVVLVSAYPCIRDCMVPFHMGR